MQIVTLPYTFDEFVKIKGRNFFGKILIYTVRPDGVVAEVMGYREHFSVHCKLNEIRAMTDEELKKFGINA